MVILTIKVYGIAGTIKNVGTATVINKVPRIIVICLRISTAGAGGVISLTDPTIIKPTVVSIGILRTNTYITLSG